MGPRWRFRLSLGSWADGPVPGQALGREGRRRRQRRVLECMVPGEGSGAGAVEGVAAGSASQLRRGRGAQAGGGCGRC